MFCILWSLNSRFISLSERSEFGPAIIMYNKHEDIPFHFYKDMIDMKMYLILHCRDML